MINISGYGILRDSYITDSIENFNELSPSTFCIYKIVPYIIKSFLGNFKSKYIETSPHDNPIIQSKSISATTKDLRLFIENCLDEIERNRVGNIDERLQRFINDYRDRIAMYDIYNCIEQDLYPIMNYDLVDNKGPKINEFDEFIFYDKLVIGDNDPLKPFKNFGKLYNISPSNIPVLEKIEDVVLKYYVIKYTFNDSKLNKLFTLLQCTREDNGIRFIFRVKPHFRTIDTIYINKQDVFIPTMIIGIKLSPHTDESIKRILNDIDNTNEKINKETENIFEISVTIKIILDIDFVGSRIYKYNKIISNDNNTLNERKDAAEKLFKFKQSCIPNYYSLIESLKKHLIPSIEIWPFGNVHSDSRPCMNMTSITTGILKAESLIQNNFEIDISQLANGFYNDFFGSKFNMDLMITDFVLKDDYIEYLNFKDSFFSECNEANKLKAFVELLESFLKKGIEYRNAQYN